MAITEANIILKARTITGNEITNTAGENHVPDEAIRVELGATIRKITQKFGDSSALKEVRLTVVAGQQDYELSAIASDVSSVFEVLRSDANVSAGAVIGGNTLSDTPYNLPGFGAEAIIPSGFQDDVFEDIIAGRRSRVRDRFSWEPVGTKIRLYPPPTSASEVIVVQYYATGSTISDLPEQCENLLVYAAVVAIFDCELNRLNRTRVATRAYGEADMIRQRTLMEQRKAYQSKYDSEWTELQP